MIKLSLNFKHQINRKHITIQILFLKIIKLKLQLAAHFDNHELLV
jgi:hypothetical protein